MSYTIKVMLHNLPSSGVRIHDAARTVLWVSNDQYLRVALQDVFGVETVTFQTKLLD